MIEIGGETQVEFVCASRVLELRRAAFLKEGHFAIDTEGGKQWRYKARNEVLHEMSFQLSGHDMDIKGGIYAYLVSTNIGRGVPGIQVTVPEIQLQPLSTPTKL